MYQGFEKNENENMNSVYFYSSSQECFLKVVSEII